MAQLSYASPGTYAPLALMLCIFGVALLVCLFQKGWFQTEMFGHHIGIGPSGGEMCSEEYGRAREDNFYGEARRAAEKCDDFPLASGRGKIGDVGDSATFATFGMFAGFLTSLGLLGAGGVLAFGMRVRFPAAALRIVSIVALVACGYFLLRLNSTMKGDIGPAGGFGLISLGGAVALAHQVVRVFSQPALHGGPGAAPPPAWGPPPTGYSPASGPPGPVSGPNHAMSFAAQSYDGASRPPQAVPSAPAATVMGMGPVALGGLCSGCQRPLTYDLAGKRWFCRSCGR